MVFGLGMPPHLSQILQQTYIDVDLVFLILAPETANGDHLKLLARVSRAFKDPTFCERLRGAEDAAALDILLNEV